MFLDDLLALQEVLVANAPVDVKRTIQAQPFPPGLIWDEYMEPGLIELESKRGSTYFRFTCPGCGRMGCILVGSPKPEKSPSWAIVQKEPLTLSPSINCVGCCGWHGHLVDGVFVSV